MRCWVLGTGSRGNAVVLESDGSRVLIDAGFAVRTLVRRLRAIGLVPQDVEAVVVTHEHADHARSAAACAQLFGWRLVASSGTIRADVDLQSAGAVGVAPGETVALSTMTLATVPVPHDAAAPVAIVATARRSGVRIGVAYDFGRATDAVRRGLSRLNVLVLESNHDCGMLRAGPYPPSVAARIAGPRGHLSNTAAADLAGAIMHRGLERIVLAHLSENCNDPALALESMRGSLRHLRGRAPSVAVATQSRIAGPFGPAAAEPMAQLGLWADG